MRRLLATLVFFSAPPGVEASCPMYAPTLVELRVLTCNSVRVNEVVPSSSADQPKHFRGTLFTGDVEASGEVTSSPDGSGLSYGRPVISPGRQYFVVTQEATLVCPASFPATVHFILYAGTCTEGSEPDPWRSGFPFKAVKIEPNPSQWYPLQ